MEDERIVNIESAEVRADREMHEELERAIARDRKLKINIDFNSLQYDYAAFDVRYQMDQYPVWEMRGCTRNAARQQIEDLIKVYFESLTMDD